MTKKITFYNSIYTYFTAISKNIFNKLKMVMKFQTIYENSKWKVNFPPGKYDMYFYATKCVPSQGKYY